MTPNISDKLQLVYTAVILTTINQINDFTRKNKEGDLVELKTSNLLLTISY